MGSLFGTPKPVPIPPEFATEPALLAYLGVGPKELKAIWWYRERMYEPFTLLTTSGKVRLITAPQPRLKHLQRRIAALLDQLYRPRHPVHGFVAQRSIKTNALTHLHRRYVLNLDLKDFFPTITENRVSGVLRALGIDERVAGIVARICCYQGTLPQGAPTSPVLSNMVCFRLDKVLMLIARDARSLYTRYADDLTFSSYQPPVPLFETALPPTGHFNPDLLSARLRDAFPSNGFHLNPDKAHYADRHSRRMVTGLKINDLVNVDRRFVRNLRAAIHSVESLGLPAAQSRFQTKYGGTVDLALHLRGKISWLASIKGQTDPVVRGITLRFNTCLQDYALKVTPTREEIRDRAVWVVEHWEGTGVQGTGFFLAGAGLVTAAHCVAGASEIDVYHPSKPKNVFKAKILKQDVDRDLAILEHSIPAVEYYELAHSTQTVVIGDVLTTAGYPGFGPGDRLNVRPGAVTSLPVKHGLDMIEVQQKIAQGMSGGPLLDAQDGVIGINHKGGPEEARDFAVHIKMLDDWLAE